MKDNPTYDCLTSGSATSERNEPAYAHEKLILALVNVTGFGCRFAHMHKTCVKASLRYKIDALRTALTFIS